MNFEKEINAKIINLWDEYFIDEHSALQPLFYPKLKKNCLLFVGCNPSFNETGFKSILKDTEHVSLDFHNFYLWKNKDEEKIEMATRFAEEAKLKHNYFKKFREVSKELSLDWEHIDLFFVHETDQKKLKAQVLTKRKLNEFGKRQVEISKEVISQIQPKIVVVANAFASDIFQEEVKCVFDDSVGCHFFEVNKKKTPVLFTSMLTSQRALDKGSFMRLKWHIRKIVNEL
jgi:hypothetical protein